MVDCFKEFFNVAFKGETRLKTITAYLSQHLIQNIYAFMCSFVDAARQRVWDKGWFKDWVKHSKYSVMKNAVSDSGFMDMPLLWIVDIKRGVSSVFVSFVFQISVELKDIFFKLPFKLLDIPFFLLVTFEFIPRQKQIF